MNKHIFRVIILITLVISILAAVIGYFYPTDYIVAFYEFYVNNYTIYESPIVVLSLHYTSLVFLVISVVGMMLFWPPSRWCFILSYLLALPGYFIEPAFHFSPISQIFYEISLIGSGVILAIMYLEPINGLFDKKSNKALNADAEKDPRPLT